MNTAKKLIITSLLASSCQSMLFADPTPGLGIINGRITDDERNPLPGAIVMLDGNRHSAITDADGYYTFTDVIPGSHALSISYIGFSPVSRSVVIRADKSLSENITMTSSAEMLGEVQVTGVFSDQQRAVNMQKGNLNITNLVSADQITKFPDSNIGDALKRISGINVQYDQGEARFGQVRGTSADLSSVTVNGSRIPSAEGDVRNVQLDLIPADMIQTIEVSKTLMPDQDGDAIGGSINLVTKNSPYRRVINATAGTGYNWISRRPMSTFGLTLGDRFFGEHLGVMAAASYSNNPSGSYDTEFIWEKDDDGNVYINDYQIRRYYVTRERQSYSLSLDWKFNDKDKIWFRGIYNNRNDWENRYRTTLKDISPDGKATVRVQTKGGTPDNRDARLERQRTMDFTLGGNHTIGRLDIDWKAGYARASEERPNERYIDYQLKKQKFDIDITNPRIPLATPLEGSTMTLDNSFSLKELTQQQEDISEEDLKIAVDFKLPLSSRAKLKLGTKFVRKTKKKDIDFYEYTPLDEKNFDTDAFGHLTDQTTSRFMPSAGYKSGLYVDKKFLGSLDLADSGLFESAQVAEELAGNYRARESVTSVYARIDSRLSDNLDFMGGLRMENTSLNYTGRDYDDELDVVTKTDPAKSSYVNFLPSLLLKWEVNKDFLVRVGYNQSLARPKYSAIVPGMKISRSDNEVTIGNPDLKATSAHNFDINGEYYFRSIGLAGLGVFYKRIDGFIVDEVTFNKEYQGTLWSRFTQPKNGGNANLFGVELSYRRDFDFIHKSLKCLGFYATYTYTHSRISDFSFAGRENEKGLSLPGSPAHTANASLYFDKWGISLRLSYNHASSFIDEMGATAFYDRYYDSVNYMDANISYTFGRKTRFTIYADCTNILNQPLRYYQGIKDRTMQAEYYGVKANAGIKVNF